MSVFNNCTIPKQQGNIGEARAIYEYVKEGYVVSKPLAECCPYDLIIDDGNLKRVSVKTSSQQPRPGIYNVQLYTSGGNTKTASIRKAPDHSQYDLIFILTDDGRCWSIPADALANKGTVQLGSSQNQYEQYRL